MSERLNRFINTMIDRELPSVRADLEPNVDLGIIEEPVEHPLVEQEINIISLRMPGDWPAMTRSVLCTCCSDEACEVSAYLSAEKAVLATQNVRRCKSCGQPGKVEPTDDGEQGGLVFRSHP